MRLCKVCGDRLTSALSGVCEACADTPAGAAASAEFDQRASAATPASAIGCLVRALVVLGILGWGGSLSILLLFACALSDAAGGCGPGLDTLRVIVPVLTVVAAGAAILWPGGHNSSKERK